MDELTDTSSSSHDPTTNSAATAKLSWLRSQLIGRDATITTPFGVCPLVYADHTASGRSLHFIETYIANKVLPFYGNSHTSDSHVGHTMTTLSHRSSAYVKRCLGGGPTDALLFCGSGATAAIKRLQEAMGVAVPSPVRDRVVGTLREEERWVVFVGPYEHHSNVLSWRNSLAEVVEIGLDGDGGVDLEALERELSSEKYRRRPMIGSFSACSNVTGMYTDTRRIARVLHRHGAFAVFDFAASGPYVQIDMRSGKMDGYDAVFVSPHKFVGGPGTPGILLMSEALYQLKSSPPSTCGGGTVAYVNGYSEKDTIYYSGVEEREDAGTPPIIQKIRAALTFWVKEYVGCGEIERREHAYIAAAMRRLSANRRVKILGNLEAPRQPILSFLVYPHGNGLNKKPLHGRFVAKLLNDLFGIQARGGCACAGPYGHELLGIGKDVSLALRSVIRKGYEGLKPGWTRVSFSYYMSKEEFEFVLMGIEFVAEHGHRFLPLYQFDWKSGDWSFKLTSLKYMLLVEDFMAGPLKQLTIDGEDKNSSSSSDDKKISKYDGYLNFADRLVELLLREETLPLFPGEIDPKLMFFEV